MKKILFLIVILLPLSGILYSEENDMDRIMPKKLVYAELPDNYPKELDELFLFYGDTIQALSSGNTNYIEANTRLISLVANLDKAKIRRLKYLLWLAGNAIPEYFAEYQAINGNLSKINYLESFTWDDIERLSVYPPKQLQDEINGNRENEQMRSISLINFMIDAAEKDPGAETPPSYYMLWPVWARVLITEASKLSNENNNRGTQYFILSCEIIETYGDKFPRKDLNIVVLDYGNYFKYIPGKECLINFTYAIQPDYEKCFDMVKSSQKDGLYPERHYIAQSQMIREIIDDEIIIRSPYKIGEFPDINIPIKPSKDFYDDHFGDKDKVGFSDFIRHLDDIVSSLKEGTGK
ncbi:MAG: hypothetical protein K9N06_01240 [Candidatus Cloacimonetes bacterium]|nr:hypothetical protein [Candidatus Cloacimonadota bacterium]